MWLPVPGTRDLAAFQRICLGIPSQSAWTTHRCAACLLKQVFCDTVDRNISFQYRLQYGNIFAVLWIRIRNFLPEPEKIITRYQGTKKLIYIYNLSKKCTIKKIFKKIQFNLYIVVISAMKCEFAVQLSHGGDRLTDNNAGSGSETHFKVGSETGAENNHSKSTTSHLCTGIGTQCTLCTSVADPDPHDFGPPGSGSGSISQRYGSGSWYGSSSFWLLSLKNEVKVPSKSNLQKTFFCLNYFFVSILKVNDENRRIRIRIRIHSH